jgi:hypothetical protein
MLFGPRATALEVPGCEIPEIIAHDTPEVIVSCMPPKIETPDVRITTDVEKL